MSILFICITSKEDAQGNVPIYCRITIDGKRSQFSVGLSIKKDLWNQKKQVAKPKAPNSGQINITLSEMRNKLQKIHLEMEEEYCTCETIKQRFLNVKTKRKSIQVIIAEYLDKKKQSIGGNKQHNGITQNSYNVAYRIFKKFENYLIECQKTDLLPEAINEQYMKSYHQWLLLKDWTNDYIIKCLQAVKTSLDYAIELGEITNNPIAFYQFPKRSEATVIYLTMEEKEKLENYSFTAPKLQEVQDLFLFQCYTGLSYSDIYLFSEENIDDSRCFIKMERIKTKQEAILPFLPQAQMIWEKYNKSLPQISNQKYNAYLKEVAGVLGIKKNLTSHVARKTFGTLVLNAGVSIEVVSKCLGHSNIRTTQQIYARINENRVLREFDKIKI